MKDKDFIFKIKQATKILAIHRTFRVDEQLDFSFPYFLFLNNPKLLILLKDSVIFALLYFY